MGDVKHADGHLDCLFTAEGNVQPVRGRWKTEGRDGQEGRTRAMKVASTQMEK